MKNFLKNKTWIIGLLLILLSTTLVYLNHFDNPFFFDDSHTIKNNQSITDMGNFTSFFTDASTFSSLPANQAYRPMITFMNAIDFATGGKLNPKNFHYHIFFWFLVCILLVYFLTKHLYKKADNGYRWVNPTLLLLTGWFALHTANAETINYICARSDSFSTMCIVASLLLYINPIGRRYYLYLITMLIGIWTKQTGVMFFPILFVYILLFEENSFLESFNQNWKTDLINTVKKIAPTGILAIVIFILNQYYLTPDTTDSTNYSVTRFEYFMTQFYVMLHYVGNFLVPTDLSADPDITIIRPWYSKPILLGVFVAFISIVTAIKAATRKHLRPISFGILWFFIALLPTVLNPLYQIANDHRTFFPYVGLFIALPWAVITTINHRKLTAKKYGITFLTLSIVLLAFHAYGTYQRNEIWNSQETLWEDVTIKSPKNGRGLMNYGLTFMSKENYVKAMEYFKKSEKINPDYYLLHTNLGILNAAMNNHPKAIEHYQRSIALSINTADPYFYYAKYLFNQSKFKESRSYVETALSLSPNHIAANNLKEKIALTLGKDEEVIKKLKEYIKNDPSETNYINLSLKYYNMGDFLACIKTCEDLLMIEPNSASAYNNICAANNKLGRWKLAEEACQKSLEIEPDNSLTLNNFNWAKSNLP